MCARDFGIAITTAVVIFEEGISAKVGIPVRAQRWARLGTSPWDFY